MGILRPAISACSLALFLFAGGVAEAAWTPSPQTVPVTTGQENVFSLVAASGPDGTTSLVWDDFLASSTENTIHIARVPLGGAPGTAVRLSPDGENVLTPRLAGGADGRMSVVWTTLSGEPDFLTQVSPSGIAGTPLLIPVHVSVAATVAVDANEVTTTAWGEGDALMFERISPAGVADPPVTVPETGPGGDYNATAAADQEGNVIIVWLHNDNASHWSLEMTRVNAAGVASPPVTLASEPAGVSIGLPKLAVNSEGDALLAWTAGTPEMEQGEIGIGGETYSSRFELVPRGATSGDAHQVPTPEGGESYSVTPALYPDGRGLLAATFSQGGGESLEALPVDGSGTAGSPIALPTPQHRPRSATLQVDQKGVATLSWLEGQEPVQMMASRIPDGGAPEPPVSLASGNELENLASTIDTRGDVTLATSSGQDSTIFTRQWIYATSCLDGNASTGEGITTLLALQCDGSSPTTYLLARAPAHGTATVNGVTGVVTYTPEAGFVGVDSFTFKATSDAGESQLATFTITVEPSPPSRAGGPSNSAPPGSASPAAPHSILELSGLRLSRRGLPRLAHRRHALMASFDLSDSAHVTLAITRTYGRWIGSKCRRTPFVGHRHQRRCSLSQAAVVQSLGRLAAGEHHLMIPASTIRHLLRPGAYELTLTASSAGERAASGKRFIVRWQR